MNIEVINLNDNLPEVDIECANSDDDVCRYTVPSTHGSPYYLIDEGETVLFNLTPEDADGNTPELLYTSGCAVGNIDPNDSTANNYTLDISLNSNNQVVLEEAFDFENSYMSWDSFTMYLHSLIQREMRYLFL